MGNFWLAEQLLASQVGLCSIVLVNAWYYSVLQRVQFYNSVEVIGWFAVEMPDFSVWYTSVCEHYKALNTPLLQNAHTPVGSTQPLIQWLPPGLLSRYSDSLRAGWSGDRIPVGARFTAPVHTGPGTHPASSSIATGYFPGVKRLDPGLDHPAPSSAEVKGVELYLYPLSGPSRPVLGWTVPLLDRRLISRNKMAGAWSWSFIGSSAELKREWS